MNEYGLQPQLNPQHCTSSLYRLFPFPSAALSNFHCHLLILRYHTYQEKGSYPLKTKALTQLSCSSSLQLIHQHPCPLPSLSHPVRKNGYSAPSWPYPPSPKLMLPQLPPLSAMNYLKCLKYLQPLPFHHLYFRNLAGTSLFSKLDSFNPALIPSMIKWHLFYKRI